LGNYVLIRFYNKNYHIHDSLWGYSNGSDPQGKIDLAWLRKNSYSLAIIRERQQSSTPVVTVSIKSWYECPSCQCWIQVGAETSDLQLLTTAIAAKLLVYVMTKYLHH